MLESDDTDPILRIESERIIAVLRRYPPDHVRSIASRLHESGLTCIEVTLDSPDALRVIEDLVGAFPDAVVGAGSVLSVGDVGDVAGVGAAFVASPITRVDVVEAASAAGMVVMPGAATPTEMAAARAAGADLVKVFPVTQLGGPAFVRSVLPPLGHPPVVVTGGVSVDEVSAHLQAGATAVGLGGSIFGDRRGSVDRDRLDRVIAEILAEVGS